MTDRPANRQKSSSSGSPSKGEPEFLVIGKLRRPHGVRGEILMEILTDFPERLKPNVVVYVGEKHRPVSIQNTRQHKHALLIKFDDIDDRERVGAFRNELVYVRSADLPPLPDGDFYQHELIGLLVMSDRGENLGVLTSILETGANDVYVVSSNQSPDILLPAIDSVILEIDFDQGNMLVHILPGLIPD
jgi:16S rRNA processing protein RimM